jgi:hypothetical protein
MLRSKFWLLILQLLEELIEALHPWLLHGGQVVGVSVELLSSEQVWVKYCLLKDEERRPPWLTRRQLDRYLETGEDPR